MQSSVAHDSLADVLERVLEKGIVIAGDVTVAIAGTELLTIKIRLLVTTVDKAMAIGINWWERDPALCQLGDGTADEAAHLRLRLAEMEERLARIEGRARA